MVVLMVVFTFVMFVIVDLVLRLILKRIQAARVQKAREQALDDGLTLEFTHDAKSLKRVEVENPKARIVAVDDEPVVLDSFRKILVLNGYSVDTVESGKEALGLIQKNDYDFLFTDLKMPEMNGVDVAKAAKHLRPDIDVIVITGYASIESAVETMKYGAMDYVQKPFTEDELVAFVFRSLVRRQERIERQIKPTVHLITPTAGASKSKREINVPAGVFISPAHIWVSLELNGLVRLGLDDFTQKTIRDFDEVVLPHDARLIEKGDPLFSICKGDRSITFPSPVSGRIASVNSDLVEHLEYIHMKPYELGWVCTVEPTDLRNELQTLTIGSESITWYQQEIDKFIDVLANLDKPSDGVRAKDGSDGEVWEAYSRSFLKN